MANAKKKKTAKPRIGRPPLPIGEGRVRVGVSLDPASLAMLEACREPGESRSRAVREAIQLLGEARMLEGAADG